MQPAQQEKQALDVIVDFKLNKKNVGTIKVILRSCIYTEESGNTCRNAAGLTLGAGGSIGRGHFPPSPPPPPSPPFPPPQFC